MRTDRTYGCHACGARFWASSRCPRCGGSAHVIAEVELAPLVPRVEVEQRALWRPVLISAATGKKLLVVLGAQTVGSVYLAWLATDMPETSDLAALSALVSVSSITAVLVLLIVQAAAPWAHRLAARAASARRPASARPHPNPVVRASAARRTWTGAVRAREPVVAPLSGERCVAYRLVGLGPRGAIDDACAAVLDVVLDDGATLEVDAQLATIDIEPPTAISEWSAPATEWLRARGVAEGDPLHVREAVLRDGERVTVSGVPEDAVRGTGLRGSERVVVVRDRAGAPLVIARAAS